MELGGLEVCLNKHMMEAIKMDKGVVNLILEMSPLLSWMKEKIHEADSKSLG